MECPYNSSYTFEAVTCSPVLFILLKHETVPDTSVLPGTAALLLML